METLNPKWLSVELQSIDDEISKWSVDIRTSFELVSNDFFREKSQRERDSDLADLQNLSRASR